MSSKNTDAAQSCASAEPCAENSQAESVKSVRETYDKIMQLFDRYNVSDNKDEREGVINEVSACLNHLTTVENKDVYPLIRTQSHPEGLEICEETHSQVRLVLDKLMRLTADIDKKDYDSEVEKLRDAVKDLKSKDENLFKCNQL
jgi:hypothetical protein